MMTTAVSRSTPTITECRWPDAIHRNRQARRRFGQRQLQGYDRMFNRRTDDKQNAQRQKRDYAPDSFRHGFQQQFPVMVIMPALAIQCRYISNA
jgi:hypothetical protein